MPRYRQRYPLVGMEKSKARFVWGQLDFPLTLFRAIRKDTRNLVFVPLEQRTMGPTVTSLLLLPLFLMICKLSRIKTVINLQGVFPLENFSSAIDNVLPNTKVPKSLIKLGIFTIYYSIFKIADQIQVFSRTFRLWVLQYGNFPKKIQLVKFGIAKGESSEPSKSMSSLFSKLHGYFLAYGHVVPRKGLEFLLDAWTELVIQWPDAVLVIAGSTDKDRKYVADLQRRIAKSNLANSVILTGFVPDSEEGILFEACNCVVFPYAFSDSMSGPLCTAIEYGKPIIATNVGLFSDLFSSEGAILCPSKDVNFLVSALSSVYESKELRDKLGLESTQLASKLDWEVIAAEYCGLLREVGSA